MHAFLREDLTSFCREAPGEFTVQQREVFCVFSGEGVINLRKYLNGHQRGVGFYGDVPEEGTMYQDDDDDDHTVHQDPDVVDDDDDETPALESPGHAHNGQLQLAVHMTTGAFQQTALGDESLDEDVDMTSMDGQHNGVGDSSGITGAGGTSIV